MCSFGVEHGNKHHTVTSLKTFAGVGMVMTQQRTNSFIDRSSWALDGNDDCGNYYKNLVMVKYMFGMKQANQADNTRLGFSR